jgi:hypothetical protein
VPGPSYTFTGYVTTGFPDYRDTATGRTLVADPGGSYSIEAIDPGRPVPPYGPWAAAAVSGAPPGPPPVPPVPPVPAEDEGSEAA